jgi:hypothetical protein
MLIIILEGCPVNSRNGCAYIGDDYLLCVVNVFFVCLIEGLI